MLPLKNKNCWGLPSVFTCFFCWLTSLPLGSISPQTRVEWEQREWQPSEKSAAPASLKTRQTGDDRCGLSAEIRLQKINFLNTSSISKICTIYIKNKDMYLGIYLFFPPDYMWGLVPDVVMVIISEVAVDVVKHAFITKFNDISADVRTQQFLKCSLSSYFFVSLLTCHVSFPGLQRIQSQFGLWPCQQSTEECKIMFLSVYINIIIL